MRHALPLLAGTGAIALLAGVVAVRDPSPGALGAAHGALAQLAGAEGCERCHAPRGLDAGCLDCHVEIAAQLAAKAGFHGHEAQGACAPCHPEHNGPLFDLMEGVAWREGAREAFDHGHVAFALAGAHARATCEACHRGPRVALPGFEDRPRARTFLGRTQTCAGCHEDVHGGGLFLACAECHGQETFVPADGFDHARFFPLRGPHAAAACAACHDPSSDRAAHPFGAVKGRACADCHASPHRAPLGAQCEACHDDAAPDFRAATADLDAHAAWGFPLLPPHREVACARCHDPARPFEARYPGGRAPDDCRACHEDAHGGQFGARACVDCHERGAFAPARYDVERHTTFALAGAHRAAACGRCHVVEAGVRRFAGTPRACARCHDDPHARQFGARACAECHDEERFLPARFAIARHASFPLAGAHEAVACRACHVVGAASGARRFVATPRACAGCHADPHGGQFPEARECAACHRSDATTFAIRPFDHARWPLLGAHAEASCASCHAVRPWKGAGTAPFRRYRGTPARCADCHADPHRGQFARGGATRCDACHTSLERWTGIPFDHARQTSFPLDATHAEVACSGCHAPVRQPDGARVVQYRPLGKECRDCHAVEAR